MYPYSHNSPANTPPLLQLPTVDFIPVHVSVTCKNNKIDPGKDLPFREMGA
jgi:hypothetical protein